MTDRDFLMWLHERLEHVHGENACFGYMHTLRAIIENTPKTQQSRIMLNYNSLEALKDALLLEEQ